MARARNIKPSFFTNELLGTYDPIISLCFSGLWCLADRDGRLEDRPLRIKAELFPYRDSLDVNGYLTVLERDGFITRYEVAGTKYIQVNNFTKHQNPHHTEKSKNYPAPEQETTAITESDSKPVLTPLCNGESEVSERSDSLIPDSGFTDTPTPAPDKPSRKSKKMDMPKGFEDGISDRVRKWAAENGFGNNRVSSNFSKFILAAKAKGYQYSDWDAALMNAIRDDWAKVGDSTEQLAAKPATSLYRQWKPQQ